METMTDNELRGILLDEYYRRRRDPRFKPEPEDFDIEITAKEITRISRQLFDHGLIEASFLSHAGAPQGRLHEAGISAPGIDVIEGNVEPPISISIDRREIENKPTYNISHSTGIQIGDRNTQQVVASFENMVRQIEEAEVSPEKKTEAKKRLAEALKHPLVVKIFGQLAQHIPALAAL